MSGNLELHGPNLVCDSTVLAAVGDLEVGNLIFENERDLTFDECEELASALFEDAAAMQPGPEKQSTLKLAQGYRNLGKMKRLVLKNVS